MPIRYNPGCPCCWVVSIAAGVYCTRWECIKQEGVDGGEPFYISKGSIYFPPQKITLWRLGYQVDGLFQKDEKELDSFSTEEEVVLSDSLGPPLNYMTNDWVDENGDLKIEDIEKDMN